MFALVFVLVIIVVVLAALALVFVSRIRTMRSIERVASYEDGFGLYSMRVRYGYDLDRVIGRGITDDQGFVDAIAKEVIPHLPAHIEAPQFGCTAFTMTLADGDVVMGRSYDLFH